MLNKIVIVGDSFMKPDRAYPGQHFSEMLGSIRTVVLSQDGSSLGMILDQVIRGLECDPDAVILGLTAADRIEHLCQDRSRQWVPSGAVDGLTQDQKMLDLLWRTQNDRYMSDIKGHALASGIMTLLDQMKLPFVWTPNLLFSDPLLPHYPVLHAMFAPWDHRRAPTNFSRHSKFVSSPGFHVDDPTWQQRFADECLAILSRQG